MTPANAPFQLYRTIVQAQSHLIPDPGSGGTIYARQQGGVVRLVSAAAETRTLARPDGDGLYLLVEMITDGGDITLTVTGTYDGTNSTITYDDVTDWVLFISRRMSDGTYQWRIVQYGGIAIGITITKKVSTVSFTGGSTGSQDMTLTANLADALSVKDSTGDLLVYTTTTGALAIGVDKDCQFNLGVSASVTGSGFTLNATRTLAMGVYGDDGEAAISSATLIRCGRFRLLQTYTAGNREHEAAGIIGQLVSKAGTNRHNMCGVMGSYEVSTSLTVDGQAATTDTWCQAAVIGRVGAGSAITTINANGVLAGVAAMSNTASFSANNGTFCGFYAGAWSGAVDWDYGLYIEPTKVACGIGLGKFASSYATGSGFPFSTANTTAARFYGECTADLTSAYNCRVVLGRHLVVTASATINQETYGVTGQMCVKNTTLGHLHAGVTGTFEVSTAATINGSYTYGVAGVMARLGVGTSILTATKAVCGFSAMYNGGALAAGAAYAYGVDSTTATTWAAALALNKCDALLYVATATNYESGVKVATVTPGGTGDCVIKMLIGATPYYIVGYAAGSISGE